LEADAAASAVAKSSGTIALRFGNLVRRVKFHLTNHARRAVAEREIAVEWIERTLDAPELIVPDPDDPGIERCFRRIVSRSLPLVSTANLAAAPAMSRVPSAPFLNSAGGCCESQ